MNEIEKNKIITHYNLALDYDGIYIACYFTYWKNQGDIPMPSWKAKEDKKSVTCKNCLRLIKSGTADDYGT